MHRIPQPSDGHGSLKDTQVLINNYPSLLTKYVKKTLNIQSDEIEWVSPVRDDEYAEYRDKGFIEKLGLKSLKVPLKEFWPNKGPQWDALGRGSNDEVFLVEAKANIPEVVTPPMGAKSESSIALIQDSLSATKKFLKVKNNIDWSGTFYQYTNRLAHLYYLRVLNKIPAYLLLIYFIGDKTVDGPESIQEWNAALTVVKKYLGVSNHQLSKYITDIFIDVRN
jgi:hypothetical protein